MGTDQRVIDQTAGQAVAAQIIWGDDTYDSTRNGGIGETDIDDVRPWLAGLPIERLRSLATTIGADWGEVPDATDDDIKAVADLGWGSPDGVAANSDLEIDGEALAAFLTANRIDA